MESEHLREVARLVDLAPPGPRIELGVHRGAALKIIAKHKGITLGVDSFEGMAEPGPEDMDLGTSSSYPKGRLAVPQEQVTKAVPNAMLVQGFIPEVLARIKLSGFAFAHVDLDHYAPTKAAIDWLWDRMMPGGVLACDDWFTDRYCLAAKALREEAGSRRPFTGTSFRKAWWVF